jgi:hypothetical protein
MIKIYFLINNNKSKFKNSKTQILKLVKLMKKILHKKYI